MRICLLSLFTLSTACCHAFSVNGTVVGQSAAPVPNVDVDFITTAGVSIPLSGDTTDLDGGFHVNVPGDTYSVTFSPPIGSGLAGVELTSVTISNSSPFPTTVLPPGFEISFQTVSTTGALISSINAYFTNASALPVFTPRNTSTSTGSLHTVIPQAGGPYQLKLKDVCGRGFGDKEFVNVAPIASVNYGQIIVGPPRTVTGRTVRFSNNAVVPSVDLDMIDACGLELRLTNDLSNAGGNFSLLGVTDGSYGVIFRPPGASGVARREFADVDIAAPLALGDVKLGTNHTVSGTVVDINLVPISGIDLNLTDEALDWDLDLNNDNTVANGTFNVIASDGTYTVKFRPPTASPYAPVTMFGVGVTGDVSLGTVMLANYVTLSGTVRDYNSQPLADADVDVIDTATQQKVFTPFDRTDSNGTYAARLSPGTWKLTYNPPVDRPDLVPVTFSSYAVPSNAALDVMLQSASSGIVDWQMYSADVTCP